VKKYCIAEIDDPGSMLYVASGDIFVSEDGKIYIGTPAGVKRVIIEDVASPSVSLSGPLSVTGLMQATVAASGDQALGLESSATGTPNERIYLASVVTSNNTPTTLQTIATSTNKIYVVTAKVACRIGSSGGGGYTIVGTFQNLSGTLTQIGSTSVVHSAEGSASLDCVFSISGTNLLVNVTGLPASNFTWVGSTSVVVV
jgi:hypothetical protein